MEKLAKLLVSPDASVREVMARIDQNGQGIALVVDPDRHLLGTVTDGDVRRAVLSGIDLNISVQLLLERRPPLPYPSPLVASVDTPTADLLRLMNQYGLRHIPLVDGSRRVVDIALLGDLVKEYELPLRAVVMAGGYGTRLRPLTDEVPKPMLPIGGRPLLERIIEQLRGAGIHRVNLTTHYKADVIARHFGDGHEFGVEIRYVEESQPLGTAGALSLIEASEEPLLVVNGDILTSVDFRTMLAFHREQRADMTVGVWTHEWQVSYGVVHLEGVAVTGIAEKPMMRHFINAGIYLLNPDVCRYIPADQPYDMPALITHLISDGRRVVGFPVREYWMDIGQAADYQRAQDDVQAPQS